MFFLSLNGQQKFIETATQKLSKILSFFMVVIFITHTLCKSPNIACVNAIMLIVAVSARKIRLPKERKET